MRKVLILSLISALGLGIAFVNDHLSFLLFLCFIPFFEAMYLLRSLELRNRLWIRFGLLGLFHFTWQLIAGSWMFAFGPGKVLGIFFINSLLFTLVQWPVLHLMKKEKINFLWLGLAFTITWLFFEQLHLDWSIAFPVFNLGTALASYPSLIQWYDLFGVYGGTLWCIGLNLLAFYTYRNFQANGLKQPTRMIALSFVLSFLIPFGISKYKLQLPEKISDSLNVLAVHPNLDCYDERQHLSAEESIKHYFETIQDYPYKDSIDLILWPENAVNDLGWVAEITPYSLNGNFNLIKSNLQYFPKATLLTGAVTYDQVEEEKIDQPNVNYSSIIADHFTVYNSIVAVSSTDAAMVRTKEKLVPFEETFPFDIWGIHKLFGLSTKISSMNFFFSGSEKWGDRVFFSNDNNTKTVLPLVCYESAFPGLTAQMNRRHRPDLITVHLNEGWYNHHRGARLFQKIAQVRAIENRKNVVRSSNRGISDLIDSRGFILQSKTNSTKTSLSAKASVIKGFSPFVKYNQALMKIGIYFLYFAIIVVIGLQLIVQLKPKSTTGFTQSERRNKRRTLANIN